MKTYLSSCSHCGLLLNNHVLHENDVAVCPRCHKIISYADTSLTTALAATLAGLILFFPATMLPLLSVNMGSNTIEMSLLGSVVYLSQQPTSWHLGLLVAFFLLLVPLVRLLGMLSVLLSAVFKREPRLPKSIIRLMFNSTPWAMPEVYLLGFLVSLTKLTSLVNVSLSVGLLALAAWIIMTAIARFTAPPKRVWYHLKHFCYDNKPLDPADGDKLTACLHCGEVVPLADDAHRTQCPTCGNAVSYRIHDSLSRTWALLATSIILFLPANLLPITTTVQLGAQSTDTIMSNVLILWDYKSYFIAIVIFLASIVTPLAKIGILIYLCLSIHYAYARSPEQRTRLFHLTEMVGRWSMIDVFVVALLGSLIQLGVLATITPGSGIIAFCAVVVTTMLAAHTFDPRLLWDTHTDNA